MERDEIYLIFDSYAKTHRGASMTLRELKRFLSVEQVIAISWLVSYLKKTKDAMY